MNSLLILSKMLCISCYLSTINEASAQRDGYYPFVTVPDMNVTVDNETAKVFSTRLSISIINQTGNSLLLETFLQSATSYYGGRSGLGGFMSIQNVQVSDTSNNIITVSYNAVYNLLDLRNSVENENVIDNLVGSLAAVKRGLEAHNGFASLYTVSPDLDKFVFSSESLCERQGCPQGSYTLCKENRLGITATCVSSCKSSYCPHDGWCIHHHGNSPPVCMCNSCPTSYDTWHIGTHCEIVVQLWMMVLFFVIVLLILISIPLILWYLPIKPRRKRIRFKEDLPVKPEVVTTITKPAKKIQGRDDVGQNANQNSPAEVQIPVPKRIHSPSTSAGDDQSQTLIASSEGGYEPGYEHILTHRFNSPARSSSTQQSSSSQDHSDSEASSTPSLHSHLSSSDSEESDLSSETFNLEVKPSVQAQGSKNSRKKNEELPQYAKVMQKRNDSQVTKPTEQSLYHI